MNPDQQLNTGKHTHMDVRLFPVSCDFHTNKTDRCPGLSLGYRIGLIDRSQQWLVVFAAVMWYYRLQLLGDVLLMV